MSFSGKNLSRLPVGLTVGLIACLLASSAAVSAQAQSSGAFVLLTPDLDAPDSSDPAPALRANSMLFSNSSTKIKKVTSGANFAIAVDNGWVVYEGLNNRPTLNFYDAFGTTIGSFKLLPATGEPTSGGNVYEAGGIVFGPCAAAAQTRCGPSENGATGVGLSFGQINNGSPVGGWYNDDNLKAFTTNSVGAPASINALAVNPGIAAYAVGWDDSMTGFARATTVMLNAANGQTYTPTAQFDLGTLGGNVSQALGISKSTTYIAGIATTATNKYHAVYTLTASVTPTCGATSSCWIDLSSAIAAAAAPAKVGKSRALVANDNGYIAGSFDTTETLYPGTSGQRTTLVSVGFLYNVNTQTVTTFGAPNANVVPLAVLDNGNVVGNLTTILPKGTSGLPLDHPFVAPQGGVITDFGTMTNAATGQPDYSCRVNIPNHLGQLVGACIPDGVTPYGAGTAFYLDTTAATPGFMDLNADLHAKNDAASPVYMTYTYTTASSIDDELEITEMGIYTETNGNIARAGFLAQSGTY